MKKKFIACLLILCMCLTCMTACGKSSSADEKKTLRVAYQYGLAYFPLVIMKEKKLIEKYYPNCTVEWTQLNSGGAICEAIISGNLDVGGVGTGPFVIQTMAGAGFKAYTSLSSQPINLLAMEPGTIKLSDIKPEDKIALVNIGSIQHIVIAMAAEKELGDARALDQNILAMAHPDGMSAMLSGSLKYHFTSPPYIAKEVEQGASIVHTAEEVWPTGTTTIVGIASNKLHDEDPELYKAVCDATTEAINYVNENHEEVAELLCKNEGVDKETLLGWLDDPTCVFNTEMNGVMNLAEFMGRAEFIKKTPTALSDLCFDNVKGN